MLNVTVDVIKQFWPERLHPSSSSKWPVKVDLSLAIVFKVAHYKHINAGISILWTGWHTKKYVVSVS